MSELKGSTGELRGTITIKRAATGKEETYELSAPCTQEQAEALGATIVEAPRAPRVHGAAGGLIGEGASMSNEVDKEK